jgi:Putative zinc-finger
MSLLQRIMRLPLRSYTCKHVGPILQQYLDDQEGHRLSDATRAKVAAHLMKCVNCGLDRHTYLEIKRALAQRETPSPGSLARLRSFADHISEHGADDGS